MCLYFLHYGHMELATIMYLCVTDLHARFILLKNETQN